MPRTIPIRLMTRAFGERTIQITPHWAGKGIAIHKPLSVDPEDGEVSFQQIQGYWRLTHIPTGMSLGSYMGSLDRAKGFAKAWDAEFAALKPGEAMAPDRLAAWGKVMEEMKTEPPRAPRAPRVRRGGALMFKRRTLIGRVSRLRKDVSTAGNQTVYSLFFDLTVNRTLRSPKVLRVCGEVWGAEQSILASRICEGSRIMVIGCVKGPDLAAMIQLPRLDLERLVEVG